MLQHNKHPETSNCAGAQNFVHLQYIAILENWFMTDSVIIGKRAKRARHSQVCSIEIRNIYMYVS